MHNVWLQAGSNASNHRQDQSALSILAHKLSYPLTFLDDIGVQVHRDVDVQLVIMGRSAR